MEELNGVNCPALQKIDYIARNANYFRQKRRPKHPSDLDFELYEEHLPVDFLRQDLRVDSARHLIFATDSQLSLLSRAKCWYADATFKVVREPFKQLFSVHAFVKSDNASKQLPLVTCLMSRRKKKDYQSVFRAVKEMLPSPPRVKRIMLDFEAATWKAVRRVFPKIEIKGCAFHYTQAVWRHVQKLGLTTPYAEDSGTYKFIRKLMALCLLPNQHIQPVFERLKDDATTNELKSLTEYIQRTWISSTIWSPEAWSVFMLITRTNNDLEGWHNRLNSCGRPQLDLYQLIALLHDESKFAAIQARLVSEKKLEKHRRKTYKEIDDKLLSLWQEYENGRKSAYQLLRACSRVYGPTE